VAAGLLALPCMMCTCCAAPVAVGLRKDQASCGASIAFWFGNSVLNPATVVFIGFVLGWNWVALRLGLGLLMVFGVGYLLNRLVAPQRADSMTAELAGIAADRSLIDPFARWLRILGSMAIRLRPEYLVLVLLLGTMRAGLSPISALTSATSSVGSCCSQSPARFSSSRPRARSPSFRRCSHWEWEPGRPARCC
jgi:uncharacterized membrane protein YraQ (UPF0718 family)